VHRDQEEVAERVALQAGAFWNRYWNSSVISGSASASATRHMRMSPGGSTPISRRSRPDEPPSSATVTIAVRLLVCSFSPRSRVERP
jgi:hypothetical protein